MSTILVGKGSTDLARLRTALPWLNFIETASFIETCSAARQSTTVVLRSGIHLGRAELDQLPGLRDVIRVGSGTDNIDLREVSRRDIALHRNPHASAGAVGEWCLAAALSLTRRIALGHNALLQGEHLKHQCLGRNLSDLDVAIWGAGPVGQAAATTIGPFARRITFARWPSVPARLPQRDPDDLTKSADIHILAIPLRPDTQRQFAEEFFTAAAVMRPALICAGRVETLDLPTALAALHEGTLSGLALDALESEHTALLRLASGPLNLLVTPHIGAQRTDVRGELDNWLTQLLADRYPRPDSTGHTPKEGQ